MGQKCGVKLRCSFDNCSPLISKSNEVVQNQCKSFLKQRNNAWRGMARNSAPGYPN